MLTPLQLSCSQSTTRCAKCMKQQHFELQQHCVTRIGTCAHVRNRTRLAPPVLRQQLEQHTYTCMAEALRSFTLWLLPLL